MTSLAAVGFDNSNRDKALDAALAESAVLDAIQPGDSVYLRVNSNSGDPYPYSTSPATIVAVGRKLKDLGVTDIRIGDRSFWGDDDTAGNLKRNGITDAAAELGTTALVFDDSVEWTTLPANSLPHWKPPVRIPTLVYTLTHVINLACVKTHFIGHITMCLKLGLGLVHATDRRRAGNLDVHEQKRLWLQIAEVAAHVRGKINILDGYEAVTSGGPTTHDKPPGAPSGWKPQTGSPKTFIASTDPIAADAVGAALLRKYAPDFEVVHKQRPFELPQIKHAMAQGGIGLSHASKLTLVGTTSPDLAFLRAQLAL